MKKQLMILIPGLVRQPKAAALDAFVRGLLITSEQLHLKQINDDTVPVDQRRIRYSRGQGDTQIDVCEAYWNDLFPSLVQEKLTVRAFRGLSLFVYWAFSGVWTGFLSRKYLTAGIVASGIAFIAWYLSTLVLFVEALAASPPALLADVMPSLKYGVDVVGGWKLWVFFGALVALLPVSQLVDISDFAKRYITEEPLADSEVALRFEIIDRVRSQVLAAIDRDTYDDVTVVGHSFGSVIAVDLMADLPLPPDRPFRVITVGSLIELLAARAPFLRAEVAKLAAAPQLEQWLDINSEADWFASGAGFGNAAKCVSLSLAPRGTLLDRIAVRLHSRYFDDQTAVRVILAGQPS